MKLYTHIPSSTSVGSVTIDPPASESLILTVVETTSNVSIPAGKAWIWIENAGAVVSGDVAATITVNGNDFTVGRKEKFEAFYDTANEELKLLPSVTILNPSGSRIRYSHAE